MFTRVHTSEPAPKTHESYGYAIALNRVNEPTNPDSPFSTHREVYPGYGQDYLVLGHYDMTFFEAVTDYNERVKTDSQLRRANVGKAGP